MKKLLFTAILALGYMGAQAQISEDNVRTIDRGLTHIPNVLCNGNIMFVNLMHSSDLPVSFYNDNFEKVSSISFSTTELPSYNIIKQLEWKEIYDEEGNFVEERKEWTERKENVFSRDDSGYSYVGFYDCDDNSDTNNGATFTQSLFNNDESFEYIRNISEYIPSTTEEDRDGDGEIDYIKTSYEPMAIGFDIVSEDGRVLQTIKFENGYYMSYYGSYNVYKIHDKYFLEVSLRDNSDNSAIFLYSINADPSTPNAIRQVGQPIKTTSVRQNNELVTIEVAPSNANRKLTVSSASGMTVWQQDIPAGTTSVQVNAAQLAKGVNIVAVSGDKGENSKFIIR